MVVGDVQILSRFSSAVETDSAAGLYGNLLRDSMLIPSVMRSICFRTGCFTCPAPDQSEFTSTISHSFFLELLE